MISQARIGRPPKLDGERAAKVVAAIEGGNTFAVAAMMAGVGRTTFKTWMARGRSDAPGDEPYRAFRAQVRRAAGAAEANIVAKVVKASDTDWRAAAFLLERRNPRRWARVDRLKLDATLRDDTAPAAVAKARERLRAQLASPEGRELLCRLSELPELPPAEA